MKRSLALLVFLTGCSVDLQIPDDANIACGSDDDCPAGTVCDGRQQCRSLEAAAKGLPGFDISPASVTVGESGVPTTVTVRLTSQPASAVTVVLATDDGSEVNISKNILTFTPENYGIAQAVTVTGERDCIADGPITSHILISPAQSDDDDYGGLDAPDVEVTTNDDIPAAGIVVTPTTGLETNETGNVTQFTVVATCKPTADVHVTLASTDETEGTITVNELTFTPDNWSLPRIVNVSGKGDCAVDGDVDYAVAVNAAASDDPLYAGIDPPDVQLVNHDVAFSRVTITPNTGLHTSEALAQTTFSVVLTCAPTGNVTVPLATSDATEGTIGVANLTFTPDNWDQAQAVIVTGVNDDFDDGNIAYAITTAAMTSADPGFGGLDPIDVSVVNDDNDTANVMVSPTTGLHTTEAGGAASFTISLGATPMSPVQISISSSNTAEGTVATSMLSFSSSSLSVTVTGVNDAVDDDDKSYTITLGDIVSADPAFNGRTVADVTVTNDDDDTAKVTTYGLNSENANIVLIEGGPARGGHIFLESKPTANVVVQPYAFEPSEFTVTSGTSLTFTPLNYNIFQDFTIQASSDGVPDTLHVSPIGATVTSTDPKYHNIGTNQYVMVIDPASMKHTYITSTTYAANTVAPASADMKCAAAPPFAGTWKAVIVDGTTRTVANNWVFAANKTYVWANERGVLGVSNASSTFDGAGPGYGFWHGGNYGSGYYWTGLDDNFAVGSTCSGWTSTSGSITADAGLAGQYQIVQTFSIFAQTCDNSYALLCIEQ